jgi:hypothetical protein
VIWTPTQNDLLHKKKTKNEYDATDEKERERESKHARKRQTEEKRT